MARYGYARVSTDTQTNDPQLLALEEENLIQIVMETVSGSVPARRRPKLSALLEKLEAGDVLTVVRLDRLGRDTVDVLELVRGLEARQVRVRILNLGLETGSSNGRLFLTLLMGMAEFERDLIRERTVAGMLAARAAGKMIGRPSRLTVGQKQHVLKLSREGQSLRVIADLFCVSRSTVHRVIQKAA